MVSLLLLTLFILGIVGGFFSGLLGIGGGIVMVPLLLYVPSLFGFVAFDMKVVAGITMMQSLGGSCSALIVHRKNKFVHGPLVALMGGSSVAGALAGSIWSKYLSSDTMLAFFAGLALLASGLLLLPVLKDNDKEELLDVRFNKVAAVLLGATVGVIGGIIGQGGAFLIIPLMLYALRIPTRIALGSSVAISFLSALAGFIGKWGTEQIPFLIALCLTIGAVLGAQIGGRLSKHLHTITLRAVLAVLVGGTALRISFSLLSHLGINAIVLDVGGGIATMLLIYLVIEMHGRSAISNAQQKDYLVSAKITKAIEFLKNARKVG